MNVFLLQFTYYLIIHISYSEVLIGQFDASGIL